MELNTLTALSPVDGRYWDKMANLSGYFSEYALMRYRVRVEVEYFIALCEGPIPQLKPITQLEAYQTGIVSERTVRAAQRYGCRFVPWIRIPYGQLCPSLGERLPQLLAPNR